MLKKAIHYAQFSALFIIIALLAYAFLFVPKLTVKLNSDTQVWLAYLEGLEKI